MKKVFVLMCLVSAVIAGFVGVLRAEGIKEGKWSMTITTSMSGMSEEYEQMMKEMENMSPEEKAMMQQMMGGMNMKMDSEKPGITTTITQCLSNEDPVPDTESDEGCTHTHSLKGNTVTFESICPDGRSTGEVTYDNDSMKGIIKAEQIEGNKPVEVTIQISGQYVGPCS